MKQLIFLFILTTLISSCISQKVYINILEESKTTDTFDIEQFEEKKIGSQYYDTLDDGTIVRRMSSDIDFVEYETPPSPNLLEVYRSFYLNGNLKRKGIYYSNDVALGVWRDYDKEGNLIKEENYDEGYEYSFEDVVKFLRLRGADLHDERTSIRRFDGIWELAYVKDKDEKSFYYSYSLDGKTGKVLEHSKNNYFIEG
ncbi:hypothetical protein V9L05_18020 [Bernardetia sp. Wsw4-3y2]|uniref:hypothetical protein n=1 Tax=Bernardetia sp. Wsw4-3y2 TaxID=3127471 RepID=UPI0030D2DB43